MDITRDLGTYPISVNPLHMEQSTSDFPSQSRIHSVHNMIIIYESKKVQSSGVGNFLAQEITLPIGYWVKMWTVLVMGTTTVIIVIIGVSLGIKGKSMKLTHLHPLCHKREETV